MRSQREALSQQRLLTSCCGDGAARLSTVVTFAFTGAKSFVTGNWKLNLRNKEKRWKQEKIRNNRETKILRQCSSFYANAHLPSQTRRLSARIRPHRCRLPLLRRTDNARPVGKKMAAKASKTNHHHETSNEGPAWLSFLAPEFKAFIRPRKKGRWRIVGILDVENYNLENYVECVIKLKQNRLGAV